MATLVDVRDAQTRLPELVELVGQGEDVVLTHAGQPVARVVPAEAAASRRIPGLHAGNITYISDDFDDPLSDDFWFGDEK